MTSGWKKHGGEHEALEDWEKTGQRRRPDAQVEVDRIDRELDCDPDTQEREQLAPTPFGQLRTPADNETGLPAPRGRAFKAVLLESHWRVPSASPVNPVRANHVDIDESPREYLARAGWTVLTELLDHAVEAENRGNRIVVERAEGGGLLVIPIHVADRDD
jgi:hypothetical protein